MKKCESAGNFLQVQRNLWYIGIQLSGEEPSQSVLQAIQCNIEALSDPAANSWKSFRQTTGAFERSIPNTEKIKMNYHVKKPLKEIKWILIIASELNKLWGKDSGKCWTELFQEYRTENSLQNSYKKGSGTGKLRSQRVRPRWIKTALPLLMF